MAVEAEIVTITPAEALKLLEGNKNNRGLRQTRVSTYAADMASGNWKLNGTPIVKNGSNIMDGQHRLHACVKAGKPFQTVIVHGVSADAHKTIDTGMARTMADEFKWAGEQHVASLAAAVNLMWRYDNDVLMDPAANASRSQLAAYLKANPGIRDSIPGGQKIGKETRIRTTALSCLHYMLTREHGAEVANRFYDRLEAGTDYAPYDPLLTLRNYATQVAGNKHLRPNATEWFALVIKAANAWLLGRELKNLRWRRVGSQREGFPVLLTREDVGDVTADEL